MKWFEGTIPEAIQQAKLTRSLFVVYIFGDDDDSVKLAQSFDEAEVSQLFLKTNCVAIKLHNKSEPGLQFSQIYPVVLVPCVFFIGENGVPLEVTGGFLSVDELTAKVNKALQMHSSTAEPNLPSTSQPEPTGSDHVPEESKTSPPSQPKRPRVSSDLSGPLGAEHNESETSGASASCSQTPADLVSQEDASSSIDQSTSPGLSLEERREWANRLLEKKREEKAREDEEKQRQQELERRKMGQEVAKLKQWKDEREKKEFENSYKKQKEEERLAREKVRAEIERDRQERALKFHQEKSDKEMAVMKQQAEKLAAKAEADARVNAAKMESARIQFRLPDASTVTNVFPSSDMLASVRTFILQRMPSTCRSVTLSTIFPKRVFSETEMTQTLRELELAPSAIIVVLPSMSSNTGDSDGGMLAPLWWFVAQILALWTVICNFLFTSPPLQAPQPQQQSANPPTNSAQQQQQQQPPQSAPTTSASELRQRQPRTDGAKRHVDGNIHRLTADDSDDESATWNGNSTQQM